MKERFINISDYVRTECYSNYNEFIKKNILSDNIIKIFHKTFPNYIYTPIDKAKGSMAVICPVKYNEARRKSFILEF